MDSYDRLSSLYLRGSVNAYGFDVDGNYRPPKATDTRSRVNPSTSSGAGGNVNFGQETSSASASLPATRVDDIAESTLNPQKAHLTQGPRHGVVWWGQQAFRYIAQTVAATAALSLAEVAYNWFSTGELETVHSVNGLAWSSIAIVTWYRFQSVREMVGMASVFFFAVESWLSQDGILPAPWQIVVSVGMLLGQGISELPNATKGSLVAGGVALYGLYHTPLKQMAINAFGCSGRMRQVWQATSNTMAAVWNIGLLPFLKWVCRRVF